MSRSKKPRHKLRAHSLIPATVGALVETAFILARKDAVAPLAGLASTAITEVLIANEDRAERILRGAVERWGVEAHEFEAPNQLAAAIIRYADVARHQAAAENLEVLADAMLGLARRHVLFASDFLKFAEIVAPLSRDELLLIGALMDEDAKFYATPRPPNSQGALWKIVRDRLVRLPPETGTFPDLDTLNATAARATRSGLLVPLAGFGGTTYALSPIGRKLREIVDINAAIRRADAAHAP
ncbi:MAG TPA: hypothetical protein VMF53_06630 [Alphaproteobacteria bacterium]|nr:hypothetical protein [Alphaproteobacteria bacterium]